MEESHKNNVFLKLILGSETVTNDNTQGRTNQDEEQQLADDDTRLVNHAGDGHIKLRFLAWVLPKKCNKYKKSKQSKKFPTPHIRFHLTTSNCIVISIHKQLLPLWFGHFIFKTTFSCNGLAFALNCYTAPSLEATESFPIILFWPANIFKCTGSSKHEQLPSGFFH